ncbi:hypothetical protein WJ47_12945 [Burkholderia ubonensis]|uniref:Decarboxylase n=1 Tax=Burkholderia ubonensis TaxID=101571 RepID=A0AB73FR73_9BURK|nr:hypothetical protein [Burkholderia ubonensis]KVK87726.1 hypothetical protein WJ44_33425 [Burkholderia ubonensis]KVL66252.1 hypothetical protein WJ47_12945 [Burkholderia ubonensis]KVM19984.1 hypothetical protein WJ53_23010 [Burkholderia ubonensis]KVM26871.1 hypothetical protein WJ54_16630 [Burkholderia ubonensis]
MRIFTYAAKLPLARLDRDVDRLERFADGSSLLSPQMRLICENPPFSPASAALVDAIVGIWGNTLFERETGRLLVALLSANGPIGAADIIVQRVETGQSPSPRVIETAAAVRAVYDAYPEVFLADARALLTRFGSRPVPDGGG